MPEGLCTSYCSNTVPVSKTRAYKDKYACYCVRIRHYDYKG